MLTTISPGIASLPLDPAPIPAGWVRAGQPVATAREISRSRDGASTCAVWACTDGAFEWYFGVDETVHILDGAVTVTDEKGRRTRLGPGDVAFFGKGITSHWEVHGHVRKLAFCRHPMPRPIGFAVRAAGALKRSAERALARMPAASTAAMVLSLT